MNCEDCGKELEGKRVDARFCNDTCKKRWQRKQKPTGKRGRPKKSTSHVTELKKRVKAKILGKAEGHSSTSGSEMPQGTDVPSENRSEIHPTEVLFETEPNLVLKFPECLHEEILIPPSSEGDGYDPENPNSLAAMAAKANVLAGRKPNQCAQPTLAQNVLSRLTSKCPSSPSVIPRGIPIK